MQNCKLIKCGDHKYSPCCIVCSHIASGTAKEVVKVPMSEAGDGQQDDWLCPECFHKGPDGLTIDDILVACIHCARKLVSGLNQV
jgi:hypothetical protein